MALTPLITEADLQARGIDTTDDDRIAALIDAATAAITEAAGGPIIATALTLELGGTYEPWLPIPIQPVRSIGPVTIDDVEVHDAKVVDGRLWRAAGWNRGCVPAVVQVDGTFGYDSVPGDIVDLACALVAGGISAAADGYDPGRGVTTVRIDDYSENRSAGDNEVINPMDLPERTRASLRARFGSQAHVIGTY